MFTANYNAYKALGRSDIYLKVSMASKPIGLVILFATMPFGVMAIAYGLLVANFMSQLVCTFPNRKLLKYGYLEQLKDLLPQLIMAAIMGAAVYSVNFLQLSNWLTLLIQIPLGAVIYILGCHLMKLEVYQYVLSAVKRFLKKKSGKK